MKPLLNFLFILLLIFSCNKKTGEENNSNCNAVVITKSGTICSNWGIKVNGNIYPSANIPAEFQQEGKAVCATYDLYEDMRMCLCCGGTWADIKSMKNLVR